MHENFKYFLNNYKPISFGQKPSSGTIERLSNLYPASLIEFISEYGFASFHGGLFQLCDPDELRPILAMAFKADPDFHHEECHVVGYTAFGTLRCWSKQYFDFDIELPLGAIYCPPLTVPGWQQNASADHVASGIIPDKDAAEFYDTNGEPMFDRCADLYGAPEIGECFGFVPALAISGAFGPRQQVGNIRRLSAVEHFMILAQLEDFQLMRITATDVVPVRSIG
ncbi:GAD-like domain-containing protein [Rhizobium tumorigenes]|uniref:GAD-like domain-containing protein n=1 Tax=Rhizobium tumorigenes TaxID=2041385 RepID=A0AAF1KT74_9HYPH|nr:GAD-like domain-containing protein [Rhizobium tumorigenes]WFR98766.1 GAD-like domain-containing protein [Rhizobium tumorigenes]